MEVHVSCLKMSDQRVNMTIALRVKNPTRIKPTKNRQGRRKYKLQNHECLLIIFKTNPQMMAITVTTKNHRLCQRKRRFNNKENMRCICRRKRRRRRKNKSKIIRNSRGELTDNRQTKSIYSTPKNEKQILPKGKLLFKGD